MEQEKLLKRLNKLQLTYEHAIKGEPLELDELTLKEAKQRAKDKNDERRAKYETVVPHADFKLITRAYAGDLQTVLNEYERQQETIELQDTQIDELEKDKVRLEGEAQIATEVTNKIGLYESSMDTMEASLTEIIDSHAKDRQNQVELEQQNQILAEENDQLRAELEQAHSQIDAFTHQDEQGEARYDSLAQDYDKLAEDYDVLVENYNALLDQHEQYVVESETKHAGLQQQILGIIQNLKEQLKSAGLDNFNVEEK